MKKIRRKVVRGTRSKSRVGRFIESCKPANLKAYWFSREGAIMAAKIGGGVFLFIFLIFLFFAKDLPSPSKVNARIGAQTTKFYDRTGQKLLYEVYGSKNRNVIDFKAMPNNIKNATVAVEDKSFYKHGAFSVVGIMRAAFVTLFKRDSAGIQGGSTITQQYVKNALLTNEQTIPRKVKELILSIEIEAFYSKDDILKLYLNEIPYGSNAYGIQAAAKTYFSHEQAKDLTLDESSLLAAIPQAPTYYSPYGQHKPALIARQHLILDLMAEQKYITKDEAEAAKKVDVLDKIPKVQNLYANVTAPHFVRYTQEVLEGKYGLRGVTEGGLNVITTLDLDQQNQAESAIATNMKNIRAGGGSNAAMVATDPRTGQIRAMIGSYDFNEPNFGELNVATAERQPGSSFKPFAYATAWSKNYGPGSTVYDVPTDFGNYKPQNYTLTNYGVLSHRQSIGNSLNVPSVKLLYLAGIPETLKTAHDMGISTLNNDPSQYGLSLVLGSGEVKLAEMTNAYESFANGGVHHESTPILKVTDSKGKILEEYKAEKDPKRVLDAQVAYLMSNVLSDNNARSIVFGNFAPFQFGNRPVAVKTGTTENFRDAWTMGYTPSLVAGVWVGNNDNTPMARSAGAIAAPVWHDFMAKAVEKSPIEQFERPAGIKEVTLDAQTGKLASDKSRQKRTDLFPSWYKPALSTESRSAKVDKFSGKLATQCTPELAVETAYANEIHAEIPANDPSYGRWEPPVAALAARLGYAGGGSLPTENDDRHNCDDIKPTVNVTSTKDAAVVSIKATITQGTFALKKLEIKFDDQVISTQSPITSNPYEFDYTATSTGGHTITATVVDEAFYSGQDSDAITITNLSQPTAFKGLTPANSANLSPGNVTFSWTAKTGANKYKLLLKRGGTLIITPNPSSGTSQSQILIAGSYTWYVDAYDGSDNLNSPTPTYSFTVL